jgi:hypothetical protein
LDGDRAERLRGGLLYFFHEACTHAEEGGEEGGAGGVEADAPQGEARAWEASGEDDPKGGGGEVARDIKFGGFEALGSVKDNGILFETEAGTEGGEKTFGMIAGKGGLVEGGFAVGLEGSEEKAGFDLGTGDGAGEVGGVEMGAVDVERGAVVGTCAKNFGSELAQRIGDTSHGSARKRGIAEETSLKRLACDDSREEAHGGATVAAIDGFGRSEELSSTAFDKNFIGGDSVDATTEGLKGMKSGEAIFARQKATEAGCARGETAEDDSSVGNAFVARDGEFGIQATEWTDFEVTHEEKRVRRMWEA